MVRQKVQIFQMSRLLQGRQIQFLIAAKGVMLRGIGKLDCRRRQTLLRLSGALCQEANVQQIILSLTKANG